ncbi:venom serine carboxypeptidase-like [Aethina tumida]|uniref:venom serine carboxypeptidase-like n=1 Tax=Aethina tumida TaxID=116153 RepID=UPI0021477A99|nr:venom serine carboxypeptidase-like [Aethina tumida]
MFSIFTQHGPFQFTREGDMFLREYSSNKNHTVLYIDNPVGTGFSFTDEGGYTQNQTKVADSLYSCLQQFFKLFPELQDNDFFVTGESFGGTRFTRYQNRMIAYINQGNYAAAAQEHKNLFLNSTGTFLEEISGVDNVYNYLHPKYDETFENHYKKLLTVKEIKTALHVGYRNFNNGRNVDVATANTVNKHSAEDEISGSGSSSSGSSTVGHGHPPDDRVGENHGNDVTTTGVIQK